MAKRLQLLECESCGHMAMIFRDGAGTMVCCNQPMKVVTENITDAAKEKHVPVIEKTAAGYKVNVGSIPHPMEEKHLIEWIELIADGKLYCQFLSPGDAPEATFQAGAAETVSAREHCNLHGYWKG